MLVLHCEGNGPCKITKWLLFGGGAAILLMLLVIVILSICLCRVCKRGKKRKPIEGVAGNPDEASLHYAELQNLPDCNRGQCDGGTCPAPLASLNNDYATVAELKETADQGSRCRPEPNKEDGMDGAVSGDQSFVEQD
ncbi:leukocyte-specific transcript 1 protein [Podarcis muralis]